MCPQAVTSRRQRLRQVTHEAHMALEELVAHRRYFETRANYGDWLRRTHAFHSLIEQQIASAGTSWTGAPELRRNARDPVCALLIAHDLTDLGLRPIAIDPAHPDLPLLDARGRAGLLGIRYVVAGSSLGARVLYTLAVQLQFGPALGARYLADRAARTSDWRDFLAELEGYRGFEAEDAHMCDVALRTFKLAHFVMDQPV
jgi:heme oxygenase (biliverdin-IX-beta and delta-forming)